MKITHPKAVALTIAGSDPSGGAGLQADLKTFQELGVYGMSVVTLLTVQNTRSVSRVELMSSDLVGEQLDAVLGDIPPCAIKLGALGSAELVQAVADRLASVTCPIIVDPVMVSKHGHALAGDDVVTAYQKYVLPLATVVTPNRFEAQRLSGLNLLDGSSLGENAEAATRVAESLMQSGAKHVLLKLGQCDGLSQHLFSSATGHTRIATVNVDNGHTHGSGCVLAAAITGYAAIGQLGWEQAVRAAIEFAWRAVSAESSLGGGIHPADVRANHRAAMGS